MGARCRIRAGLLIVVGALALGQTSRGAAAGEDAPVLRHDFGRIVQGAVVTHEFRIGNDGPRPFRLERIETTAPVKLRMAPAEIPPGGTATAVVTVQTAALERKLDARLRLFGQAPDDQRPHAIIELAGEIFAPVTVEPGPAIFLTGTRADTVTRAVELVSHESEPLEVRAVEHASRSFSARVETVEASRRVRIVVSLDPKGPVGKDTGPLLVRTSSALRPEIRLTVHTMLRERVYTFPESVDFGTVRLSDLKRGGPRSRAMTQTLMVYGKGSTDFDVAVDSDVPSLGITSRKGPQGDRFQQEITLLPDQLKPGPIHGTVSIRTNDKEFPRLSVPVTGNILDR